MLASLNCPSCGAAAASPTASQCEYCGSTLTRTSCPSCFGAIFVGMQFCPHCGAKGDRSLDESAVLPCPACKSDMQRIRVGATPLFECAGCQSTWLDADTFTRLCIDREAHGAITAMVGAKKADASPVAGGKVRYLPCPICKQIMNRENFGRRSGVVIDVCRGHGVWFEAGELPAVISFIDSGGLELARGSQAQRLHTPAELEAMAKARAALAAQGAPSSSLAESVVREALRVLFSS
jgi:Zn-finger nucleic acid-binding protein